MVKKIVFACIFLLTIVSFAQTEAEITPPFNIKTITFVQNRGNVFPVFHLGETFQLQFDDLNGNEANYYYQIVHCDYDWKPSQLSKAEYLRGFDDLRIQNYTNSFNTLQPYSHYELNIPNQYTQLRVSGNYMLKVLDEDREVVFSKKFILYEDLVKVPTLIKTVRNFEYLYKKQNVEFAINPDKFLFQNPLTNVKVLLMQNGKFYNSITDIRPQYTIGNDLIYKYTTETQFWAGNEFLNFENKDIRAAAANVAKIDPSGALYSAHLYTNQARGNSPYTYYPDINGNFVIENINSSGNPETEADYVWIYFTLSAPNYFGKKNIYVNGMFNNYAVGEENKMEYNEKRGLYEKAILIKQGFTNFQYVIADEKGKIDEENALDGNYNTTENIYFVLAYYRGSNQRYDRVIGKGTASSLNISN
ncbi:MAG: DUF5103 domain-containing protein [Flavobacterium sp.]